MWDTMDQDWIFHFSTYSIFITATLLYADICDLWAAECQPRCGRVRVCARARLYKEQRFAEFDLPSLCLKEGGRKKRKEGGVCYG